MPVVPTYEDRGIRLDPGLNFRDNTHATPEMFGSGIGTALGTVGKGLTDIGQAVSDVAIAKEKARAEAASGAKAAPDLASVESEAAANVGLQRAATGLVQLRNGNSQTLGYRSLAGTEPVDTFLRHQEDIDKVVQETRDGLILGAQAIFDGKVAPIVYDAKKQDLEAQAQARKAEIPKGYWAGASTYQDQAVAAVGDETRYQSFMASGLKEIEKLGFLQRWEPEHADRVTAAYISEARKRAALKLAEADPIEALTYSLDYATELTNADKMALHDAMEPGLKAAMKRESAHYSQANPAPDQFAAPDLSPAAYVLLGAVVRAGALSYDARSGGGRFDDFAAHPGMVGFGGTSTKAGRYGLDGSTWERIVGLTGLGDFSPASQDRGAWALAQKNYRTLTNRSLEEDIKAGRWADIRENLAPTWAGLAKLTDEDFAKLAGWPTSDVSQGASVGGIGSDAAASAHAAPLPSLAPSLQAPTVQLSPETEALLARLPPAQAEELRNAGFAGVLEDAQERARGDAVLGLNRVEAYRQRIDSGDRTLTLREIEEDVTLTADQKAELRPAWEAKNQEVLETERNVQKFTVGELKFDSYGEQNQRAVDRVWERVSTWGDTPEKVLPLLNGLIRQTGIVPSQVIRDIRQGLNSKDQATVAEALQMSQRLMTVSGEAVQHSNGGDVVESASLAFRHMVVDLNYPVDEAAQIYIDNNNPSYLPTSDKSKVENALLSISADDVANLLNKGDGDPYLGFNPEQEKEFLDNYKDIYRQEAKDAPNLWTARANADEKFRQIYGITNITGLRTVMRYPPEDHYPAINGSWRWMQDQLLSGVRSATGDPTLELSEIALRPSRDAAERRAAGLPIAYDVSVIRKGANGQPESKPLNVGYGFIFELSESEKKMAEEAAAKAAEERQKSNHEIYLDALKYDDWARGKKAEIGTDAAPTDIYKAEDFGGGSQGEAIADERNRASREDRSIIQHMVEKDMSQLDEMNAMRQKQAEKPVPVHPSKPYRPAAPLMGAQREKNLKGER